MTDAYEIPEGYRTNPGVQHEVSAVYWTDERIAASRRFQRSVYQLARRLADHLGTRSIVDIGCGTGAKLARLFAGLEVHGIDAAEAVAIARRIVPGGHFVAADLDGADLDLDALLGDVNKELILCADVIEHLPHPEHLLGAIRKFATRDSRIILSTPDRERLVGPHATRPSVTEHVREWSTAELRRYLARERFVVIDQYLEHPFRFGVDRMTARFVGTQIVHRLPLRTNQVVVCRVA